MQLISEEYRKLQTRMHGDLNYGLASIEFAPYIAKFIKDNNVSRVLDYGCGKARLARELTKRFKCDSVNIVSYDPAIPDRSTIPAASELVTCIDVLEHIEPELISNVLDDLRRVTEKYGIFTIATEPSKRFMPDGRNAHLIQEPFDWWRPLITQRFTISEHSTYSRGFMLIVTPLAP